MKNKVLSILLAAGMMMSTVPVLANEAPEANNTPLLISAAETQQSTYVTYQLTIDSVGEMIECTAENGEQINLVLTDNTVICDGSGELTDISNGDVITAFINGNTPAPAILPAQYTPDVVVVENEEAASSVMVEVFKKSSEDDFGDFISVNNALALNIGEDTEIVNRDGSEASAEDLDNNALAVFYDMTTRSLPPQTSPNKVIVLNEESQDPVVDSAEDVQPALKDFNKIVVGDKEIDYVSVVINGKTMVPLRSVAEGLNFRVDWFEATKSIIVGAGYSLSIGNENYVKGKAMPIQLGQAPVCINFNETGITYVPVEYFTEVLECEASVTDGVLTIK